MKVNEYKGFKSSRVIALIVGFVSVTLAYVFNNLPSSEWIEFMKWAMAIYGASEVGAKVAAKGED